MENIVERTIEKDLKESYLDYAMSVIVGRALPDIRDGLKPVHRRILFSMYELSNTHDKPYKKSARVVGECLGKFHPHGDTAIYDSLVRMAQDFSLRYTLVDGQGNFGSIDGDNAAAMRYCVTQDSLIISDRGLEKIGELSKEEKINRMVLSVDNKINTASRWFDSGEHQTKKITTYRGFNLCGTLNHPILIWEKNENRPRFKWKIIQDLKIGDYAVINRAPLLFPIQEPDLTKYYPSIIRRTFEVHQLPKKMNPDLAFLIGAIVAEGNVSKEQIGFCNGNEEFLEEFKSRFKKVFPDCRLHEFKRKPVGYTKKPYTSLEIHSIQIIEFFRNMGLLPAHAKEKQVPDPILKSTKESISAFIKAYAEGDGSVYRSGAPEIALISMSLDLLKKLQLLLLRFGIDSSYRYQLSRKIYKLLIRGFENLNLFGKEINFLTKNKTQELNYICKLNSDFRIMSKTDFVPYISNYIRNNGYKGNSKIWLTKHNIDRLPKIRSYKKTLDSILNDADRSLYENLIQNNYLFDKIASIEDSGIQKVYSIKVDSNCHSFISNGFISHNTEVRMEKIAEEMLSDLEKETVAFTQNFDGTLKEPLVMPSKIPNLLINGSAGIAVGMATNIPPHNLTEIVNASIAFIEGADESKIFSIVSGPDFPTAGLIVGKGGIFQAYKTGRGIIRVRGKAEIKKDSKGKDSISITEIPYQVTKTSIIESIANSVRDKKIDGISGVHDRSDKQGIEVIVELKKDANAEVVLNQLYAHTPLEGTFGIINLVLVNNEPKVLGLYDLIRLFIEFRKEIVTKRCQFDLKKAEERAHILTGLIRALENIDAIVAFLKVSKNVDDARAGLVSKYSLSEIQANAILDMRLQRLIALEREKIENEYKQLQETIAWLKKVLSDVNEVLKIIKDELVEIKSKYGDSRRTAIIDAQDERPIEALIPNDEVVITITGKGYTKRVSLTEYRSQNRGGKGVIGADTKEEDFIKDVIVTRNHNYLLVFTDKGRVHWIKSYEIPESGRYAGGKPIVNLIELQDKDEKVTSWISVENFSQNEFLCMVTKNGIIKRISLDSFSRPRNGGIIAITLKEKDDLVEVIKTNGKQELLIATKKGQAIRFSEEGAREIGRTGQGVIGIRFKEGEDQVVGITPCSMPSILTITENGFGKRTPVEDYRIQGRGGSGVINIKTEGRNGNVVGVRAVKDDQEIIVISSKGQTIRVPVTGISIIGRNTQGVTIIRLDENEKVASFAIVEKSEIQKTDNQ